MSTNSNIALVTGAGSGIGRALAELFAEEGSAVVLADIDAPAAEAVADGIRSKGGEAMAVAVDVSDASSVDVLLPHRLQPFV